MRSPTRCEERLTFSTHSSPSSFATCGWHLLRLQRHPMLHLGAKFNRDRHPALPISQRKSDAAQPPSNQPPRRTCGQLGDPDSACHANALTSSGLSVRPLNLCGAWNYVLHPVQHVLLRLTHHADAPVKRGHDTPPKLPCKRHMGQRANSGHFGSTAPNAPHKRGGRRFIPPPFQTLSLLGSQHEFCGSRPGQPNSERKASRFWC